MRTWLLRPWLVVAAVVLVLAVVLGVGWFVASNTIHGHVKGGVADIIAENNRLIAAQASADLGPLPSGFSKDHKDWKRVQSVIEDIEFGAGGFACIIGPDGKMICHPEIENPMVRDADLSSSRVVALDGSSPEKQLTDFFAAGFDEGIADFGVEGRHLLKTKAVSDDGVRLLVHQPITGLTAATAGLTAGMIARLVSVGLAVMLVSGLSVGWVVHFAAKLMRDWNAELSEQVDRQTTSIRRSREALATITEYRDNETGQHVERISACSVVLGDALRDRFSFIDDAWLERLRLASMLHDIGKVAVPDAVLLKPGRLTDSEYEQIKRHPSVGADTLLAICHDVESDPLLAMAVEVCLYHHERWDGGGYPVGLAGDDIPLSARITSVVDVFDALLSPRVYKPAMELERVVEIIREGAGTQFDPDVVEVFESQLDKLLAIRASLDGDALTADAAA
ncbi:MAG: HD domain-containing phosphohydrolase [Planctomycetota bacterium]